MEIMASKFMKPRNRKFRQGTIHRINWNRMVQRIDSSHYVVPDNLINKDHYGLIVSHTPINVDTCMVIPIKTNRNRSKSYDVVMECCINDNHPSILQMDQMCAIPIECIDPDEFGEFKEEAMEEVFRYIDIMMGRRNGSVPATVPVKQESVKEEIIPDEKDERVKLNIWTLKAPLKKYLRDHYMRTEIPAFRVRVDQILDEFNKAHKDEYREIATPTLIRALDSLGYKITRLHREYVIWGLCAKDTDFLKDLDHLCNNDLMDKYCMSVSEAKDLRHKFRYGGMTIVPKKHKVKGTKKRLTENEWKEVFDLFADGSNVNELADAYGVSTSSIYKHLKSADISLKR